MFKRYGSLAKHYVALERERPGAEAIIALLRSRTQPFVTERVNRAAWDLERRVMP